MFHPPFNHNNTTTLQKIFFFNGIDYRIKLHGIEILLPTEILYTIQQKLGTITGMKDEFYCKALCKIAQILYCFEFQRFSI